LGERNVSFFRLLQTNRWLFEIRNASNYLCVDTDCSCIRLSAEEKGKWGREYGVTNGAERKREVGNRQNGE
jgi:hypothetical protein